MKILVTGGSGFIGKAFIKKYKNDFDVVAPTKDEMDLLDARQIEKIFAGDNFDAVLHLAGVTKNSANPVDADNLIMFKNIQYLSIVHGVKNLIIVGDGAEFDTSKPIVDFSEDMIGNSMPTDSYGLSRYMINLLASKDKITTSLRVFDVYGRGGKGVIDKIVTNAAKGRDITINCDRIVSAIYIEDLIKIIAKFLKGGIPKGDYNVTSGDKMSYYEIAKYAQSLARRDAMKVNIKVKGEANEYSAVNDKLQSVYAFKPMTIKTGVKKMYTEIWG